MTSVVMLVLRGVFNLDFEAAALCYVHAKYCCKRCAQRMGPLHRVVLRSGDLCKLPHVLLPSCCSKAQRPINYLLGPRITARWNLQQRFLQHTTRTSFPTSRIRMQAGTGLSKSTVFCSPSMHFTAPIATTPPYSAQYSVSSNSN